MRYQGGNRPAFVADLAVKVNNLLEFSNPCQHAPYPEGRSCDLGHSQYGDRGGPTDTQKKFSGTPHVPTTAKWLTSTSQITAANRSYLRGKDLPIIKVGDKILAPPPATDYAAYRAHQIGVGEMLKNDILKKVIETKEADFHEGTPRPDKSLRDPRYDYTLADLPIKIGVTLSKEGHVATIIATHQALDREAKKAVNALRSKHLSRNQFEKEAKHIATQKREKALELMNEWRVEHKLLPVEWIEP